MSRLRNAFRALTARQTVVRRPFTMARTIGKRSWDVIGDLLGTRPDDGVIGALNRRDYLRLRAQARELERTSPLMQRYKRVRVENVWGPDGITLQALPPITRGQSVNASLAKQNEAAFYEWAAQADVAGGSLHDAMEWFEGRYAIDGEVALEMVFSPRYLFGVKVRRVDADLIDYKHNRLRRDGVNAIDRGVEIDANGQPVAYYVLSHRDDDVHVLGPVTRRRVPAERMLVEKYGDDVRGVTPMAAVIVRVDHLNKLQEAVVAGHRAAACQMGFFTTQKDGDFLSADPGSDMVRIDAQSGVTEQLPAGMDFKPWVPGAPGAQYREIYTTEVHEVCAALEVTYVSITGDLTEANYSSMRQGELSARESYRLHHRSRARRVLQPLYEAVMRGAMIAGRIVTQLTVAELCAAEWHGRTWDWVDPLKDVQAIREQLALGLTTRTRELNKLGLAAADVFRELSDEIKTLESLNIPTAVTSVQAQVAATDATANRPRLTA